MPIISTLISLMPQLIETEFTPSPEGSTKTGVHETAVAAFFHSKGFLPLPKTVMVKKPRGKKFFNEIIMNCKTHSPKPYDIDKEDGLYTILAPYSKTENGSRRPSPDLYLVSIVSKRIVEWVGIECKSSKDSLCPMWNEHLPRDYVKGNILYFFSGYDKETKKKMNTIFTSEIFFQGKDGRVVEEKFWHDVRSFMTDLWNKDYAPNFPMVECKMRQFCGQYPFTPAQMASMVSQTTEFLKTLI